jgi:site-specific DNA recombinase
MKFTELWLRDVDFNEREREFIFDDVLPVVACYLRVSTDEQAEENHSIETQAKKIRCECEHRFPNGAHLFYVNDEGYSGTLPYRKPGLRRGEYRPGLTLMTQMAEHGYIQYIAVYKCNRFTRNLRVWYEFDEDYMDRYGIDFFSATEPVGDRSAAGKFITNLLMASSSFERDQIVGAAWHGLKQRQAEGYPLGAPPYGWQTEDKRHLAKGRRPSFEPIEEQAEIVRRVVNDYLSGSCMNAIATRLTESGVPTPKGKSLWGSSAVKTILTSPIHCGLMKDASGNLVRGQHFHNRIIEEEQYYAVQKQFRLDKQNTDNKQARRESVLNRMVFAELIRCGVCANTVSVASAQLGNRYVCGKNKTSDHPSFSIDADILEDRLIQQIEELCTEPLMVGQTSSEILRTLNQQSTSLKSVTKDVETKLKKNSEQFIKLARDYNRGDVVNEEFTIRKSGLNREKESLSDELEKTQAKLAGIGDSSNRAKCALDTLHQFPQVWESLEIAERKELVASLIDVIELKPCGLGVDVNIQFASGGNQTLIVERRVGVYYKSCSTSISLRDLAVVHCFAKGCDEIEVARVLHISILAVRNVCYRLKKITGIANLSNAITDTIPLVNDRMQEVIQVLERAKEPETDSLTKEELAVLECVAINMPRAEITRVLNIPIEKISDIRLKTKYKLCARDWKDAVAIAVERGLIKKEIVDIDRPATRQMQTLRHFAVCRCISYCARMLDIAYTSAREHLRIMRQKYGVRTNDDLVDLAIQKGWIHENTITV